MHPMLILILAVFGAFGATLGFYSIWSNQKETHTAPGVAPRTTAPLSAARDAAAPAVAPTGAHKAGTALPMA
ncbi:MAG TPA: hypothetical protein VG960_02095 [Caulobacteraceae bacterium]|nr:hypothetical protein [Caulobacteraceae bacterium]